MGLWQNIQIGVSKAFGRSSPTAHVANKALAEFLTVGNQRHDELTCAIGKLEEIEDIGGRIGKDTDKRIEGVKTNAIPSAFNNRSGDEAEQMLWRYEEKAARAQGIKDTLHQMRQGDQSEFHQLYADAHSLRESYQASPIEALYRDKKASALLALAQCEFNGSGDVADDLRKQVDAQQCKLDDVRDGVISRFRLTDESLAKHDPQILFAKEIARQEHQIDEAHRNIDNVKLQLASQRQQGPASDGQSPRLREGFASASLGM